MASQLVVVQNRNKNSGRFQPPSRSKVKLSKQFASDLDTPCHDVNHLPKVRDEIGTEVDLHFSSLSYRFGKVKADIHGYCTIKKTKL